MLPLIGIVHATALIFAAIGTMTGSADAASVIAFLAAASMTLVVYVALPMLGLAKLKDTIEHGKFRLRGSSHDSKHNSSFGPKDESRIS